MAISVCRGKHLAQYTFEDLMPLKRKELMALFFQLGKYNPMPFALIGPPEPWVGPDIPFPD